MALPPPLSRTEPGLLRRPTKSTADKEHSRKNNDKDEDDTQPVGQGAPSRQESK